MQAYLSPAICWRLKLSPFLCLILETIVSAAITPTLTIQGDDVFDLVMYRHGAMIRQLGEAVPSLLAVPFAIAGSSFPPELVFSPPSPPTLSPQRDKKNMDYAKGKDRLSSKAMQTMSLLTKMTISPPSTLLSMHSISESEFSLRPDFRQTYHQLYWRQVTCTHERK